MTDPMAAQMTQLLLGSDLDELREIVKRWIKEAPSEGGRKQYEAFGRKLLELKEQMASLPVQPQREELEMALSMMLSLAAQKGPHAQR